ncbi:MAG TPA: VWA domain-containing protein [Solirubrobacteraceae bacterium]|nr:VWA domain-containing protein [Solirubrobacteraceae bacterium]
MSFASPLVLLALLAIPLLIIWYYGEQRRRAVAASAFVAPALTASVAPRRPRWRRHVPMLIMALALAALIAAAARPQRSVAVPITNGAIMLANDVSGSMNATDVAPSRLGAAERAAKAFLAKVPSTVQVGLIEFARTPTLLQSPTTDHALTANAFTQLKTSGGTAVGVTIETAMNELKNLPPIHGKRPPGAIVLISDGASNVGVDPIAAARQARAAHIPIYTVAVGTPSGVIQFKRGKRTVVAPVPVSPQQLGQIAQASGGRAFTASNSAGLSAVYSHLAAQLGRKHVNHEITASFAGGGLVLLLLASAMSLHWFGRLV